jgi:uncharacterized protein (TIGR02266 family)
VSETNQVLLVDDDRLIRVMVGQMISDAGCEPVLASSATEAIGRLATLQPLAAFIDLYMPDSHGDECCKIIKSNEELSEVPVVLMTASNAEVEVQRAFLAGADDFLPKPVRPYQLAAKLKAVRDGHRRPIRETPDTPIRRVLVADHDGFFRTLVGNLLERAGYDVVYAESGLTALRLLLQGRPKVDLSVLDMAMPGFAGIELLRKIRAVPQLAKLAVFATLSTEKANILEELYTLEAAYVIQKTALNLEEILRKANQLLFRGRESRMLKRVRFYRLCDFRYSGDGDWLTGFIFNLSNGGIALRTLTALPLGTVGEVRFNLTPQLKCEVKATVAWANEFNPRDTSSFPYGMGMQFTEIMPESEEWISAFLKTAEA